MATGELISDRSWHLSPSLNYSVSYETQRPDKYSKTVKVRFTVTIRSLYSNCSFGYPIYFSNTIDNQFRTITSSFGSGVKSVSYTSDWISFSNAGTSLSVGITPKCGDVGHTSYDTGTIYFDAYEEPLANITSLTVQSKTVNSVTLKYTTDRAANLYCSIDGGATWLNNGNPFVSNTTSGTFTVYYKDKANTQKLDYNTSYTFRVLCRSTASGVDTSKDISATTYDIARISSLANFEHGSNASVTITNPARNI